MMTQRLMRSAFILALAMLGAAPDAQARVNMHVGIGFPGAMFAPPPPVIVAQPAAFWAPPLVYSRHGFGGWHHPRHFGPRHVHRAHRRRF